ncbi:hypothetical protein [Novosphingobium sp.]|uniref:hypothetical protein n=1 Tax=Novosphingobium sp. TaxID=1874826 RepID=UPI003340511D
MRRFLAFCALVQAAPALAAAVPAPPAQAAPASTAEADAAKIESLQQRLLASQQTIATLERELASAKNRAVVMDECRVKNGRLVFIGRELIEGYEKRYQQAHKDPLQLGRRRFEFELQALSDAIYTNRIDVPVPPPVPGDKRAGDAPDPAPKPKKRDKAKSAPAAAPAAAPDATPDAASGPATKPPATAATPGATAPTPEQAH